MAISRRGFIGTVAAAGLGAGAIAVNDRAGTSGATESTPASVVVDPHGAHQAGIATATQSRLVFAAFDMAPGAARSDLLQLLQTWSSAITRMTAGELVANDEANPQLPPQDTGEALGLGAANLTVTLGFGPTLFDSRFGLAAKKPAALADIPAMPRDALDPEKGGGDLCIQACADDPVVAFHAMRNLRRLGEGVVVLRWAQLGFGSTAATSTTQQTPRNLMGFKDGTNNLKSEDAAGMDKYVWVGDETDQPWMKGGSYVVTRRITMRLEQWDRDYLADQENTFGRKKDTGAPLGEATEHAVVPLTATAASGLPIIPEKAHIRLAAPATNGGITLLRRGYSFTDGVDEQTGELDAGLFFIAFQQDPRTGFIPVQRRLAANDALNEYIQHTSSAVFAIPPGFTPASYLGSELFA